MSKIYVAGRTSMLDEVRIVQAQCRKAGHEITHDWTQAVEEIGGDSQEQMVPYDTQADYARADMGGVMNCDLLILVAGPNLCGTLIETGMAIAWGKTIWIVGELERESVFFHLPKVLRRGPIPTYVKEETQLIMALRYLG